MRDMNYIAYLHAGFCEGGHKRLQKSHFLFSKCAMRVMIEGVDSEKRQIFIGSHIRKTQEQSLPANTPGQLAKETGGSWLIKLEPCITLCSVARVLRRNNFFSNRPGNSDYCKNDSFFKSTLLPRLYGARFRFFIS